MANIVSVLNKEKMWFPSSSLTLGRLHETLNYLLHRVCSFYVSLWHCLSDEVYHLLIRISHCGDVLAF